MNRLKKISIAVVEDYPIQRKELELLLELEGFEVFGVDSGHRSSTVKAKKWPFLGLSTDINHRLML